MVWGGSDDSGSDLDGTILLLCDLLSIYLIRHTLNNGNPAFLSLKKSVE